MNCDIKTVSSGTFGMTLMLLQTGRTLQVSPHKAVLPLQPTAMSLHGITRLHVRSMMELTGDPEEDHHTVVVVVVVAAARPPVDQAMASGRMADMFLAQLIHVWNVSSLVSPTILPKPRAVSTSRITMIFPLKHLVQMFQSLASNSPILL